MSLIQITDKQSWRYIPIPEWLAHRKDISYGSQKIYTILYKYLLIGRKEIYPSVVQLSKHSAMTERYVKKCIKELEGLGLIKVQRRGSKNNNYTLFAPEDHSKGVSERAPKGCPSDHLRGVLAITPRVSERAPHDLIYNKENNKEKKKGSSGPSSIVLSIFDHWKDELGMTSSKLDQDRIESIKSALEKYSEEDVATAIDGCAISEWHKENGHTSLEYILRNSDNIEKFIAMGSKNKKEKVLSAAEAFDYFKRTKKGSSKVARSILEVYAKLEIEGDPYNVVHHPASLDMFEQIYNNDNID